MKTQKGQTPMQYLIECEGWYLDVNGSWTRASNLADTFSQACVLKELVKQRLKCGPRVRAIPDTR